MYNFLNIQNIQKFTCFCLSLSTCDCLLANLWLGLLSNCTVLLALLVCVVWNSVFPEYLNLDPILKKFCRAEGPFTGALNLKNAWCSMAHFHKCLQAFSLCKRKTKVCSCSRPWSSSSTTTKVSFFFLKSSLPIFGQKNNPIFWIPSKTKMPVGVNPKWYSQPSLPYNY